MSISWVASLRDRFLEETILARIGNVLLLILRRDLGLNTTTIQRDSMRIPPRGEEELPSDGEPIEFGPEWIPQAFRTSDLDQEVQEKPRLEVQEKVSEKPEFALQGIAHE
eukprot:6335274-Amphidinium_carterae.2